ncbi:putative ubx domain protein [Lasiodiplodia theobromae]|uniref:Ubx domain protein n=1 Tax=Lasiodiplodia theobromae TaxID=45133 RepID=A0A8H7IPZ4_9PEZI|nr:Ubx domain protein [Lasiodiplodia theobromae]KAF4536681.1 Ubx domain protein [Lasiodiplodia theobromae]KAF9629879.1 putative ubx domain protein [Lasiodiplodia theobromae]
MDDNIASFTSITGADPQRAAQYLQLTDNNLEQAIQLFFDSPNLDLGAGSAHPSSSAAGARADEPINIDSDDDDDDAAEDASRPGHSVEDDEAMARRLQEEMYGAGGRDADADVRAPMARTTETLVGPGGGYDEDDMHTAIMSQMAARRRPPGELRAKERRATVPLFANFAANSRLGRAGIFNQQAASPSVWESEGDPTERRRDLATSTGGASEASSKSSLLAEMYRPPFEIMCRLPWDEVRDQGKEDLKWILVNVQDPAIFDCQVLNRDIWKNDQIKDTVKENFLFLQYNKDDARGSTYVNYYFQARDSEDAYPHIAIVDPRTGEQVKVWSGPPVPKPMDFLMQLHEFLDRYSLKANARNPIAKRKPESKKKDVHRMTEEEMLEMALQQSMAGSNGGGPRDEDPDELTKSASDIKGKNRASESMDVDDPSAANGASAADTPFARISSTNPHEEPPNDPKTTTRIQFRHAGGREIRRFALADSVRRIYEWLKASPLEEGKAGAEFELNALGMNLIDHLDETIEDVGLKMGTIMVEYV